jgi:hypothetical protein
MKEEPRVLWMTPTPSKGGTRILKLKNDLTRNAIREAVPQDEVGVLFSDLPRLVKELRTEEDLQLLGSNGWYTTAMKLELEVRGEIERIPDVRPQRLRRPHFSYGQILKNLPSLEYKLHLVQRTINTVFHNDRALDRPQHTVD